MKIVSPVWLLVTVFIFLIKSTDSTDSSVEGTDVLLNYRLPNDTYPDHYDIKITTDVHSGERAFQGEVVIDIVVVSSTKKIVLHGLEINISHVNITNVKTGKTDQMSHQYDSEREFLILEHKGRKVFKRGSKWKLAISYNGQLRDDLHGFCFTRFADLNGKDRYIAQTNFGRKYSRHAFPCYDEPAKRARFTITINHSPNYTAISNMPVNKEYSSAGKSVFLTTARIPVHTVAFVVCDFEYSELNYGGIRHRVYSRSIYKRDHQFVLSSGILIMKYLSEYFGTDYMVPKLDYVSVIAVTSESTSNGGLALSSEEELLYNNQSWIPLNQPITGFNIAQLLSHLWFGHYVTVQWWSNFWLEESLPILLACKAIEYVYPEYDIWELVQIALSRTVFISEDTINSRPLTAYVQTPSDIEALSTYSYRVKGVPVLRMWEQVLGEETFRRALQNFLKNNRYSAASEEDLFAELEESSDAESLNLPASISEMMDTWTHQANYPILTVTRNYNDGSFTVKQETFFIDETVTDNKTWYVPINFAVASNPDFLDSKASHYMPNSYDVEIDAQLAPGDWIILNKRADYFYRIKYDEENYKLITQTLIEEPSKIHPRNRAQLLQDAYDLSYSNRLKHEIFFEMLTYLKKEDQAAPWKLFSVMYISRYEGMFIGSEDFRHFVSDLVRPIFNKLGVNEIPGESTNDKHIRSIIIRIACSVQLSECMVETHKKLKAHLMENITINNDIKDDVINGGIMQADDEVFDIMYQKLMNAPDDTTLYSYSTVLGLVLKEKHIKKLISTYIGVPNKWGLKKGNILLLDVLIRDNPKTVLACIEFLRTNLLAYEYLIDDEVGSIIDQIADFVHTKEEVKEFLALVEELKERKYISNAADIEAKFSNLNRTQGRVEPLLPWISHYLRR